MRAIRDIAPDDPRLRSVIVKSYWRGVLAASKRIAVLDEISLDEDEPMLKLARKDAADTLRRDYGRSGTT